MKQKNRFALIDLGSSTVKLNIYDIGTKELLYKESKTVNMAENFYPSLELTSEALSRVQNVLEGYKSYLDKENIESVKLVTTGVARKARNAAALAQLIYDKFGWDLEIISGDKEAELFYRGVTHDFEPELKIAAVNIGGGSTEITIGTKNSISRRFSFPVGVSKLNEQFLHEDPPTEEMLNNMFTAIEAEILLEDTLSEAPHVLVHTGGELEYMEITRHPLEDSTYSPSHPKQITRSKFAEKYNEIKKMQKTELYKYMPENPKWMDGAVACTAIALAIAKKLGVELIIPSNKNLNDGLLLEFVKEENF